MTIYEILARRLEARADRSIRRGVVEREIKDDVLRHIAKQKGPLADLARAAVSE